MDCTLAAEGLARDARSSSRLVAGEGGGWGKLQIFVSVNMSVKGLLKYLIVTNLKFRKYLISRFWRENISRGFIFAILTRKCEKRTLTQHFFFFFFKFIKFSFKMKAYGHIHA